MLSYFRNEKLLLINKLFNPKKNDGGFPPSFLPKIIVWFFVRHPYNALRIATFGDLKQIFSVISPSFFGCMNSVPPWWITPVKTVLSFSIITLFSCRSTVICFIKITHGSPVDNEYLQRVQCVHVAFKCTHFYYLNLAENWLYLT